MEEPAAGSLSWRLSSHPMTLLCFLGFRIGRHAEFTTVIISPDTDHDLTFTGSLVMYTFGMFVIKNFVLVFILTMILLAMDFYNIKNIAGRRLVGLRWWNEVDTATGESHMVFESMPPPAEGGREINATDKRFFWLALYVQPLCWIVLAILALVWIQPIWISLNSTVSRLFVKASPC